MDILSADSEDIDHAIQGVALARIQSRAWLVFFAKTPIHLKSR
jgi:hypothetical protein